MRQTQITRLVYPLAVILLSFLFSTASLLSQEGDSGNNGSPSPTTTQQKVVHLIEQSREAARLGKANEAVKLMNEAVESSPSDISVRLSRASLYAQLRQYKNALFDYDAIIKVQPKSATLFRVRGGVRFKAGDIQGSIEDFNRCIKINPGIERELWERGISYYYVGEYSKGSAQFKAYQTYSAVDVENIVWRYLCQAKAESPQAARRDMMPLEGPDRRVPMIQIYNLFRGAGSVEEVLDAVKKGDPNDKELGKRLFYAHLYLGIFYEANSDNPRALKHLREAHRHKIDNYMWDVVHVHLGRLAKKP